MIPNEWNLILAKGENEDFHQILNGNYFDLISKMDLSRVFETASDGSAVPTVPITVPTVPTGDNTGVPTSVPTAAAMSNADDIELFCSGIACLLAFIQQSWTGPSLSFSPLELVNQKLQQLGIQRLENSKILYELMTDGEELYSLVQEPVLLYLAHLILVKKNLFKFETYNWWRQRCLMTLQKLLDNPSSTLYQEIKDCFAKITVFNHPELLARYHLELGNFYSYYSNYKTSIEEYSKAQKITGLEWELTGVMGKRTKFQQFETSQLVIVANSSNVLENEMKTQFKPRNLNLNDDTLLEKMESSTPIESMQLNPTDQCILLSFCLNYKNTNPEDGLVIEQMMPFVNRVLENCNDWMITTMGLILRSRLESQKSRTVERSCLQLQALVDQWNFQQNDAPVQDRMVNVFSLLVPTKWELEVELGQRFVSIGVVRSGLEIFTRLQMYEKMISCYQLLDEPKKAEMLLLELLEKNPTSPKYLCLMGDVKQDFEYYLKAWESSNHKYARAMRSLAYHYFRIEDWQTSIDCFQKALEINAMFENSWFVQGCAALKIGDLPTAANSFIRVTRLDPLVIII